MYPPRAVRTSLTKLTLSRPFSRRAVRLARTFPIALAAASDENGDEANKKDLNNKLQIPTDSLAFVAGAWQGSPSKVPADLLASVADLPMTKGAYHPQNNNQLD